MPPTAKDMTMDAIGRWCVLRCAGRMTLGLAETLETEGFTVWTPAELERFPGKRARRMVPLMPTFIFAAARHLWTLVEMADAPGSDFSVFRYLDRFPVIADEDLKGLREAENEAVPKAERPAYAKGEFVQATDGAYSGLPGTIIRCRGGDALVLFGWQKVKISTFILKPSSVISTGQALRRIAV